MKVFEPYLINMIIYRHENRLIVRMYFRTVTIAAEMQINTNMHTNTDSNIHEYYKYEYININTYIIL